MSFENEKSETKRCAVQELPDSERGIGRAS